MGCTRENRLPAGLQAIGRPFAEGTLFRLAFAYEQATHHRRPPPTRTSAAVIGLAVLALLAFAANSVLARLALGSDRIDRKSFTAIRPWRARWCSGSCFEANRPPPFRDLDQRWTGAALLFLYAAPFSFAYVSLPTPGPARWCCSERCSSP